MFDISLIIPTYGRDKELERLLCSLTKQTYPLNKIEIIIVDQNDSIDLSPIINSYKATLNIVHKKINEKGSARAKNIGINLSKASLITFPDDDCTFYEDTIASAISFFEKNPSVDVVYGRVYDRETKTNVMRQWLDKTIQLNIYNFHLNYSAITCFSKRKDIFYDTDFGTGAFYPSGDELGYIISAINRYNVFYTNTIDVWHPQLNLSVMPLNKIYNYAVGYGAILKKNASFPITFLFCKSSLYQAFLTVKYALLFDKTNAGKHYAALKGRLTGFFKYKNAQ